MGQKIYEYAVTFKAQVSEHKALNLEALERSLIYITNFKKPSY